MVFEDRKEAGRLLDQFLKGKVQMEDTIVLGIPRGVIVVAKEVAQVLGVPLSVLIFRKLGVPLQPELALGAVDPDGEVCLDEYAVSYFKLDKDTIENAIQTELDKIKEREKRFLPNRRLNVEGKQAVVVDDGIVTSYVVMASVNYLKRHGAKKITVAIPACPVESLSKLRFYSDEVFCYYQVERSPYAVGMFYNDFR